MCNVSSLRGGFRRSALLRIKALDIMDKGAARSSDMDKRSFYLLYLSMRLAIQFKAPLML